MSSHGGYSVEHSVRLDVDGVDDWIEVLMPVEAVNWWEARLLARSRFRSCCVEELPVFGGVVVGSSSYSVDKSILPQRMIKARRLCNQATHQIHHL
jgi:hypothetical protein